MVIFGIIFVVGTSHASFNSASLTGELVSMEDAVDASFAEANTVKKMTYKVKKSSSLINLGDNHKRFLNAPVIELTHWETGSQATYRVIADTEGLYISGIVKDSRLNANSLSKIWTDDSIEIMIDVDNNGGKVLASRDYKFLVNLINIHYSSEAGNADWNGPFQSTVRYEGTLNNNNDTDSGYTVEVKIPWTTLGLQGLPTAGTVFGLELGMNDSIAHGSSSWYRQRYWSNADGGSANNPSGWGSAIFSNEAINISPQLTFVQSNTMVYAGGSVKLTWSSINAGYCIASGDWQGPMALNGMETIADISTDKTYTLTCGGYGGTIEKTLHVKVLPEVNLAANFSVDKVVSVDGDDFANDVVLKNGETAFYRVIVKNEGRGVGNTVVSDTLTIPTNGGSLGNITDLHISCPPAAVCSGSFTDGGVIINNLKPKEAVVLTYNRLVSSTGIGSADHSIIVDTASLADGKGASTSGSNDQSNLSDYSGRSLSGCGLCDSR